MTVEERRSALLQAYRDSRAALLAAIAGLSEDQMSAPAPDGWSVRDHLAHIAHMDELRSFEIQRLSRGYRIAHPASIPEEWDSLNAWGVNLRRPMSLEQVLWELEFTRDGVLETIGSATERGLDQSNYGELGLDGGAMHEQEHAAAIRAYRSSQGL